MIKFMGGVATASGLSIAQPTPGARPVAKAVAITSSPTAPRQIPAHRGHIWDTPRLLIGLPLPSPPATMEWVETTVSSPVLSPQAPARGRGGLFQH